MVQNPKSSSHEPPASQLIPVETKDEGDGLMSDVIFKLRVNQLVTTLRTRPLDGESSTMLGVLESLVIAGEIPFDDFMQRVQNLFPHVFDEIDADLREKLFAMLAID